MAEIRPFRAWRYHPGLTPHIHKLTAPLFDVVSARQREMLYREPHNAIHLSLPLGDDKAAAARRTLDQWRASDVLVQDAKPAIYAYYQYFNLPNDERTYCRKGFVCLVKAYTWEEQVVLRHENTIPGAVNDRIDLLMQTALNTSPTHGLYTDRTFELEYYLDEAMERPVYEVEDYQGVKDCLAVIDDPDIIEKFVRNLKGKKIILADGHHRYESSIAYRQHCTAQNPDHQGDELYNYHLMYFTNTEAHDLRILPTHRLVHGLPDISEEALRDRLADYFDLIPVENAADLPDIITGKRWAFGWIIGENAYKIRLRPDVHAQMHWQFPDIIKTLDLTVLHYFVIEKALGIKGKAQRNTPFISFERNPGECLRRVLKGEAQMAFLVNEVTIETVRAVCHSGYTMPQKSTYFYPKAISGFLFAEVSHP